jgi:hypothetical protein
MNRVISGIRRQAADSILAAHGRSIDAEKKFQHASW